MAEQMQGIKRRIKSINSTERITNAMKLVSAAKLRHAKSIFTNTQEYLSRLIDTISETFEHVENVPEHFLDGSRKIKTKCFVVITSSSGLCGSFNGNVLRFAESQLRALDESELDVKLVTVGAKGRTYLEHRGYAVLAEHDAPADSMTFDEAAEISNNLIALYLSGEIDEIDIIYTSYINTLKQEVKVKRLLPFDVNAIQGKDKFSHPVDYGPSPEAVFAYLVPKYIEMNLYRTCIESATCEYAARRMAMENANENAKDMLDSLETAYNRARQSQITDQIIEIVAGSEAQR
ncbi:F-type H+-transporting ATPase subunit gamma [Clostridiales Family XIII bacterium PM5-7]